jgi:NAD(P)-dependent dehydrogenase (short-subunit alcohol dehydrogenase family)
MVNLAGRVCPVAGASRGVGRGIARGLAEAGATVIVTGRSSEAGARTDGRPESVEDTARLVEAAGGKGFPYLCDHTSERAVDGLVAWALRRFGRIDVAVSSVWSGNEGYDGRRYADGSAWGTPFWRRPAAQFGRFMEGGAYAALLLARAVAPAMIAGRQGLVVLISYDTQPGYLGDLPYDLSKAALNRLALACAEELRPFGVAALALSPASCARSGCWMPALAARQPKARSTPAAPLLPLQPRRTSCARAGAFCPSPTSPLSTASPTRTARGRRASSCRLRPVEARDRGPRCRSPDRVSGGEGAVCGTRPRVRYGACT